MILGAITATVRIAIVYLGMTYHIIAIGTGYLYHILGFLFWLVPDALAV